MEQEKDIVERLRVMADLYTSDIIYNQAADEIERLRLSLAQALACIGRYSNEHAIALGQKRGKPLDAEGVAIDGKGKITLG